MEDMNREQLLQKIREYQFFIIDLNLYLDNHPKCTEALSDYKKINTKLKDLKNIYEAKYGPLCIFNFNNEKDYYNWIDEPWPWEN